jgi:hypothetical protein
MKPDKPKSDPRCYMPWAGMFAHPDTDPEAFRSLPGWRQREIHLSMEMRKSGRSATLEDLRKLHQESATVQTVLEIPASWSYETLRRLDRPLLQPPPNLNNALPLDRTFEMCTVFGEGRILRPRKPLHGLFGYIWLLAAYRKKLIPALPISAFLELEEYFADTLQTHISLRVPGELADSLLNRLDTHVEQFIQSLA